MAIRRLTPLTALWALALGAGACAPPPGTAAPIRTFPTIDEAKACARDALVSVGFLPETLKSPGADAGVVPGETPTSVGGRLVTPLGNDTQIDYARASARVRIGPQGDTTVTVGTPAPEPGVPRSMKCPIPKSTGCPGTETPPARPAASAARSPAGCRVKSP